MKELCLQFFPNILKGKRSELALIDEKTIKMLLSKCWTKKIKDRISFSQIVELLIGNEFLSIFDFTLVEIRLLMQSRYKSNYKLPNHRLFEKFITYHSQKKKKKVSNDYAKCILYF